MDLSWITYIALAFAVSLLVTAICTPPLLRLCRKRGLYDLPNERKVHHNKVPRLGGVLFMPSMLVGCSISFVLMELMGHTAVFSSFGLSTLLVAIGMFLLYIIGLLDDLFGMRAALKFCIQLVVSLFLPFCGLYIHNLYGFFGIHELPMWLGYALTMWLSIIIVNATNLIDGIDGLASSLAILAMGAFGTLFVCQGMYFYALFCFALAGSLIAFWFYNMFGSPTRGTKTFMGDTGSLTLGYALAFVAMRYAIIGTSNVTVENRCLVLLVPFTLLFVPCADSGRVALKRLLRGRPIFHPDKTHLHHKCLRAGFTMHQSLALICGLQIFYCATNWLIVHWGGRVNLIVFIDLVLFLVFNLWLDRRIVKNDNPPRL